ncbi:hypothetical protein CLOLEP_01046 [[Clostridium] leptum DSM 753]|uniref:Uncharacterized protein n=1 Tax=[Clostridium] leptum DSM 753 TaxID=428125 RepID=A7VR63_9FIRM|nr:hypothetical protein CLOLEP_01046 [[Clostridium] leptum DSM 753]
MWRPAVSFQTLAGQGALPNLIRLRKKPGAYLQGYGKEALKRKRKRELFRGLFVFKPSGLWFKKCRASGKRVCLFRGSAL